MKVTIEVDCTPLEARTLLGLPDVEPLQKAMMKEFEGRISQAMSVPDVDALMKQWAPIGMQSLEQFQKLLWGAAAKMVDEPSARAAGTRSDEKKPAS